MIPPFTPIKHLETWALSSSLRAKLGLFEPWGNGGESGSSFVAQGSAAQRKAVQEWRALREFMLRVRKLADEGKQEVEEIRIDLIPAGRETLWERGFGDTRLAVCPIVTNPEAYFFSGPACLHIPIGAMTAIDTSRPVCATNWGETPHVHVWVEFRQREVEDE